MKKLKKRTILILGGSGFIGKAVISELLKRRYKVIATYNRHKQSSKTFPDLHWVLWDATKEALPKIDWNNISAVLHLANYSDLLDFPENARQIYKISIESVFNLLDKAYRSNIKRVVIASTGAVLGGNKTINSEFNSYLPINFYSASKACAEILANEYSSIVSTAVLRFFYPYGNGGQRYLVGRLINNVKKGEEILIEGRNGVIVNPVYLSDLAKGVVLALESDAKGIFHLPGLERISLRGMIELIGRLVGKRPVIRVVSRKTPGGHAGFYSRAKKILGYIPKVSLKEGIERTLDI